MITCAAPPTKPDRPAFVQRASANPLVKRPVLRIARRPAQSIRVTCDPPAAPEPQPPIAHASDRADVPAIAFGIMPMLAALPEPVEPLAFDAPSAGPTQRTWTLASAPPPAWWPVVQPWNLPAIPGVSEPPVWMLLLAALAVLVWLERSTGVDTI